MDTDLTELRWFKSSASSAAGCVEIAHLPEGGVAVRDSKDRSIRPVELLSGEEQQAEPRRIRSDSDHR